jgi:methionyl-tRNA formyltransferase
MLRIVFMGTPEFSVPILEALIKEYNVVMVVTQPDKEVGRKREIVCSPVKKCALEHNIPVFQPTKIRVDYQPILDAKPDLIVTAAYGQIVGMKLLNAPKYRSINVHASLLPKYRGGAPIHYSVMNGDSETGVTIMYMEKTMDSGDILNQRAIPIEDDDTTGSMFEKLSIVGRDLLMETIPLLVEGKITPIPQDEEKATFAYNITNEEKLVDFNKTAKDVFNHIRAYNPSPIAYMELKGDQIKLYDSVVVDEETKEAPGTILLHHKNRLLIACGNNTVLELLTIQPTGKKIMSAKDFINGGLRKYL